MISESLFVYGLLIFIWIRDAWEIYLSFRQWDLAAHTVAVPEILDEVYPVENFSKARLYTMDALIHRIVHTLIWDIVYTVVLLFEVLIPLWTFSNEVVDSLGFGSSELGASAILVMTVSLLLALIVSPLKLSIFMLEKRYGICKETLEQYVLRLGTFSLLHLLVLCTYLLGCHLIFNLIWANLFETHSEVNTMTSLTMFSIACIIIYMKWILPADIILTVGYSRPIPDNDLRQRIFDLVNEAGFPLEAIYVCEASKISIRSNAFVFKQKIVLSDTLISEISTDEIIAVIAHELGHSKGLHVYAKITVYLVMYIIRIVYYVIVDDGFVATAFNLPDSRPLILEIIFVWFIIFLPLDYLFNFLLILLSRKLEIEADDFAVEFVQERYLYSALIKLNASNFVFPVEDWLFQTFIRDHPGLLERLENLS